MHTIVGIFLKKIKFFLDNALKIENLDFFFFQNTLWLTVFLKYLTKENNEVLRELKNH